MSFYKLQHFPFQTAERQGPNGKWSGSGGPRPSPSEVRPRAPTTEAGPPTSRPDIWGM